MPRGIVTMHSSVHIASWTRQAEVLCNCLLLFMLFTNLTQALNAAVLLLIISVDLPTPNLFV